MERPEQPDQRKFRGLWPPGQPCVDMSDLSIHPDQVATPVGVPDTKLAKSYQSWYRYLFSDHQTFPYISSVDTAVGIANTLNER